MNELAIDVQGLTKYFGAKVAVDHISLQVEKGAIFGFLGANGSGKTTTIRMICGLLEPSDGEGFCLGYDIKTQTDDIKKHTGYMPQQFSYYTKLTVLQNLRFIADIFQIKQAEQAIQAIVDDLGLMPYLNTRAANLSGGWKQSLALSCSLLHKPQLLFLDEPTAGVDPKARKDFWDYLHSIARKQQTTILVTTHYMDEAEKCTHLAYINLGTLLYSGKTKDLIPESQIKTYQFTGELQQQGPIIELVKQAFPDLSASIVNNELRISSKNETALNQFLNQQSQWPFKSVIPSFEEVFIGLMK